MNDDLPEWTEEQFARAQLNDGDKIVRRPQGKLTRVPSTGEMPMDDDLYEWTEEQRKRVQHLEDLEEALK